MTFAIRDDGITPRCHSTIGRTYICLARQTKRKDSGLDRRLELSNYMPMSSKADRNSFKDAGTLAEFANLRADDMESFRHNYPDFVPDAWWDYTSTHGRQWESSQGLLRRVWEAWSSGTSLGLYKTVSLIMSVFDPNTLFDTEFGTGDRPPLAEPFELPVDPFPFHKALEYLNQQPWRAKKCENCGRYIVVRVAKTKYCNRDDCGNNIREQRHRAAKLRSWHRNKRRWRAGRKKIKSLKSRTR